MSAAGVEAIIKPLLTDNIAFKPLDRIYGTIFLDEFARDQGRGSWLDLAELAEKIRGVERASKHHLPWIKLAWFGDTPQRQKLPPLRSERPNHQRDRVRYRRQGCGHRGCRSQAVGAPGVALQHAELNPG